MDIRVLIVDDSEDDTLLTVRNLKQQGYNVIYERVDTADGLKSALARADWDVVLTDYSMPHFSGMSALALIRRQNTEIPCIVLSGVVDEGTAVDMMRAGANDYIMKDNITRLAPAIERELAEAKVRQGKHQADITIARQRDFLSTVIDSLDHPFYVIDVDDYTVKLANKAVKEYSVWKDGITCYALTHNRQLPCDGKQDPCPVQEVVSSGKSVTVEHLHYDKDGKLRNVEVHAHPIFDEEGKVCQVIMYSLDITERKRTEDELRLHGEIVTQMSEGVYLIRAKDGIIVYTNPEFNSMFGYESGEMIGKDVSIVNAPTDRTPQETTIVIAEQINKDGYWDGEVKNIKKDGTTFLCRTKVSAFDHPIHGRVFLSVHADITEHKKQEEEIREMSRFPADNPNPVLRISSDGTVIYANRASDIVLQTWGISQGQRLPEPSLTRLKDAFDSGEVAEFEFECIDDRIFSVTLAPEVEPGYINVYGFDITIQKRASEHLLQKQKQLRFQTAQLSLTEECERRRIAEGLHDNIIQPLVFLDIKLKTLLDTAPASELADSYQRMRTVITDLIQDTRSFTFDLANPVLYKLGFEKAVEQLLKSEFKDRHGLAVAFVTDGKEKPLEDNLRNLLFKAVKELLTNTVKHAQATKVEVSFTRKEDDIVICVKDDGVGFLVPEQEIPVTGFGLFNIQEHIDYLGGRFDIESKHGNGTKITITLPLQQESLV